MPDSHAGPPAPSDHGSRPAKKPVSRRPAPDDDAIDFSLHSPHDEGESGALSFHVSRSGPLSGSSVLPWSELIKQTDGRGPDESNGHSAGRNDEAYDPASDADLLREVLSAEPPPS